MITPENFDQCLDTGQLFIQVMSGRWWAIRRNGKTRRWKRDPAWIEWPVKYGMYGYLTVTPEWIEKDWVRRKDENTAEDLTPMKVEKKND
jgi:hypothetical protein